MYLLRPAEKRIEMRSSTLLILVLFAAGFGGAFAVWRHRHVDVSPATPNMPGHVQVALANAGVTDAAPVASSNAGAKIRFTRVASTAAAATSGAGAMPAKVADAANKNGTNRDRDTDNGDPIPKQKPTAELFREFTVDDPTKVFLPETVRYHEAVQGEAIDPDWGPAASQAIRNYIAAQGGDRFELPLVDCRQDLCEVEIAGRFGGDLQQDMTELGKMFGTMPLQPWWTTLGFDQQHAVTINRNKRVIGLFFYSRK